MKTTTDNHIDKLLHEAMKQRAAKVPPLADDFAEKVLGSLGSLTPRPLQKKRGLKFWPLVVAACMVGFVVIFLAPPKSTEEQQPLAMEETIASSQEPRVESQQPIASSQEPRVEKQQTTVKAEQLTASSQQPRVESQRPTANSQQPKLKSQQPIEEPMLAEAEINSSHLGEVGRGALPEMEDPFLAIAQQIQDIRSLGEQVCQEVDQLMDNQVNLQ